MSNWLLFLNKLKITGIYINFLGEIQPRLLLLPLFFPHNDPFGNKVKDPNIKGDNFSNIDGAFSDVGGSKSGNVWSCQSDNMSGGKSIIINVISGRNLLKVKRRIFAKDKKSLTSTRKNFDHHRHRLIRENTSNLRYRSDMANRTIL